MHVLIPVLHRPTEPTGVCRHAVNLAQCLVKTIHIDHVTLLIGEWQKMYFEKSFDLNSPKIKTIAIDIPNTSSSRNLWFLFGLPKVAQQLHPDIIHLAFPLPFIRRWFDRPLVSTIHDLYPYDYPENFGYPQVWFNQLFLKQCVYSSDGLTCVSKTTLNSLSQYFPSINRKNQARAVIYNYVNFDSKSLIVPSDIEACPPSNFILCVAQHRKNKNLDLLIKAFAQLVERKTYPSLKLILVGGTGPETENLENLVNVLSLRSEVLFLSALSDQELCWLYNNCQVFAIPSSTEGFCLPLVEALFFGSRVVCSNISIFREVTEVASDRCQFFNLSGDSLANLTVVLEKALSLKNSESCFSIKDKFSEEVISKQLTDFYSQVQTNSIYQESI